MSFDRNLLPAAIAYFSAEGIELEGRSRWRTGRCDFHGGSDSLRVNVESGAWRCMACGTKGGNVLDYAMQRHGLSFIEAARALGAYTADSRLQQRTESPRPFSARDALTVIELELNVCTVVISDVLRGVTPNAGDWQRYLEAAGRVGAVAQEAAR